MYEKPIKQQIEPEIEGMEEMNRPCKRRRRAIGKAMRQVFKWRMRRWERTLCELTEIADAMNK